MKRQRVYGVEYDKDGNMIAFKCKECGKRLKPVNKKHTIEDCNWYKNYSQNTRNQSEDKK